MRLMDEIAGTRGAAPRCRILAAAREQAQYAIRHGRVGATLWPALGWRLSG